MISCAWQCPTSKGGRGYDKARIGIVSVLHTGLYDGVNSISSCYGSAGGNLMLTRHVEYVDGSVFREELSQKVFRVGKSVEYVKLS